MTFQDSYTEMEKDLFKDIVDCDFMHFFTTRLFSNRSREQPHKPKILHGSNHCASMQLKPTPGRLDLEGCEFCSALLRIYNDDYWLIKLWVAMYTDTKGPGPGRELVRAFILNCIDVTAAELAEAGEKQITTEILNTRPLSSKNAYYKKIFSSKIVHKKMRYKQRMEIKAKYDRKGGNPNAFSNFGDIQYDRGEKMMQLLQKNEMHAYIPLVKISVAQESEPGLKAPLEYIAFVLQNANGKRKIRKQLIRLAQDR